MGPNVAGARVGARQTSHLRRATKLRAAPSTGQVGAVRHPDAQHTWLGLFLPRSADEYRAPPRTDGRGMANEGVGPFGLSQKSVEAHSNHTPRRPRRRAVSPHAPPAPRRPHRTRRTRPPSSRHPATPAMRGHHSRRSPLSTIPVLTTQKSRQCTACAPSDKSNHPQVGYKSPILTTVLTTVQPAATR